MRFLRRYAVAVWLFGLGLTACAGPALVAHPEGGGIELRWPSGQDGLSAAQAEADARCSGSTQHAELAELFTDGDETVAHFYCR